VFPLISWIGPLVWSGYRRELKQEDLYANLEGARSQKLLKDSKSNAIPTVFHAFARLQYITISDAPMLILISVSSVVYR